MLILKFKWRNKYREYKTDFC